MVGNFQFSVRISGSDASFLETAFDLLIERPVLEVSKSDVYC